MKSKEYELWFGRVNDNLLWAESAFKDGYFPLVCFLSQQAIELALKGFCYFKEEIPPKTHDLQLITKKCEEVGLEINREFIAKISILSGYYLESRYPDILDEDLNKEETAAEALMFAKEIVEKVESSLPSV